MTRRKRATRIIDGDGGEFGLRTPTETATALDAAPSTVRRAWEGM